MTHISSSVTYITDCMFTHFAYMSIININIDEVIVHIVCIDSLQIKK